MATKDDTDRLAKAIDRATTFAAIIHVAAEESPAVSEALYRAAAKVARMTSEERDTAALPPIMRAGFAKMSPAMRDILTGTASPEALDAMARKARRFSKAVSDAMARAVKAKAEEGGAGSKLKPGAKAAPGGPKVGKATSAQAAKTLTAKTKAGGGKTTKALAAPPRAAKGRS